MEEEYLDKKYEVEQLGAKIKFVDSPDILKNRLEFLDLKYAKLKEKLKEKSKPKEKPIEKKDIKKKKQKEPTPKKTKKKHKKDKPKEVLMSNIL